MAGSANAPTQNAQSNPSVAPTNEVGYRFGGGLLDTPAIPTPAPQFYDSQGNKQLGNFADNINQHIVGLNVLEGDRLAAADINGDGKVNISDTTEYLRRDTGIADWNEGQGADYYNQFYQQGDRYVDNPNAGQKRGDKYMKYEAPAGDVPVKGGPVPATNPNLDPDRFLINDRGTDTTQPTQGGKGGGNVAQPTQGGKGGGNVAQPTPQPAPFPPANTGPTAQQPNINTQSAQGITSAMQGAQQEMGYRPQQVLVPGTSATIGGVNQSTRIGDPGQSGTIGGVNQSAQVQAGQLSGTNFDPYMNPYTDAVIKSAEGDILRGGEKALTGLGSQASSAGAFGGSRHGIAMGEMGRNITEQMAKSATGLRQANFQQAQQAAQQDIASRMQAGLANQRASQFDIGNVRQQQLANQQASQFDIGNRLRAGQLNQQASQFDIGNVRQAQLANQQAGMKDIQNLMQAQQLNQMAGLQGSQNRLGASQQLGNLANLGFGMGQTVQGNLAQQGTQQQAMMQALIDAAKQQYGGYTGHPAQGLGYVTQALGATGTPTSTTESSSPGLFGYLTAASQIPGLFPSDRRLKKNITKMGQLKSGLNIYKWEWIDGAKELGADMNHTLGVIAQEVKELFPNAVVKMDNGYYAVNYSALR